jgi:lysosomal acid lipase/cholesteryl ester hydrolase
VAPVREDKPYTHHMLFEEAGYKFEEHKITTKDGYINTAWRIIGKIKCSKLNSDPSSRPPIVLQHGLAESSATWLVQHTNVSVPFRLFEEGFDVWILNNRGNIYSNDHINKTTHNFRQRYSDYYKFTWDHMAKYDVPANIDYVISHSKFDKVSFLGYSQGTTQFFAAMDVVDKLESKINAFIGWAPVMFVGNITNPFVRMTVSSPIPSLLKRMKVYNIGIFPEHYYPKFGKFANKFKNFFWRIVGLVTGLNRDIRVDISRIPIYAVFEPGGTSLFNLIHWKQIMDSGNFEMYDYGSINENLLHYGVSVPPKYNIQRIVEAFKNFPSFFIVGDNDALVTINDFNKLVEILKP